MSDDEVKAVYDFYTMIEGELSFQENEVLTIIHRDIGEGWWEAQNDKGQMGLVPISYFVSIFAFNQQADLDLEECGNVSANSLNVLGLFRTNRPFRSLAATSHSPSRYANLDEELKKSVEPHQVEEQKPQTIHAVLVHCDFNGDSSTNSSPHHKTSPRPKLPPKPAHLSPKPPPLPPRPNRPARTEPGEGVSSIKSIAPVPLISQVQAGADNVDLIQLNHSDTTSTSSLSLSEVTSQSSCLAELQSRLAELSVNNSPPYKQQPDLATNKDSARLPVLPWKPPNLLASMSDHPPSASSTSSSSPVMSNHMMSSSPVMSNHHVMSSSLARGPPRPPMKPPGLAEWMDQQEQQEDDDDDIVYEAHDNEYKDDVIDYDDDDDDDDDEVEDEYDWDDGDEGEFFNSSAKKRAVSHRKTFAGDDCLSNGDDATSESSEASSSRSTHTRSVHFSRGDSYLFNMQLAPVPETVPRITITNPDTGLSWMAVYEPYTCVIKSPIKKSKFHGIKSFIVYQITPSFTGEAVSRRYKHFDWLQQRLADKFSTIAIPPLPEKQISGRFEGVFVTKRLKQLQLWMNRMCNHPVISQSEVFLHFLTCTDAKVWKTGKRKAEKDKYQGGMFFQTVLSPPALCDLRLIETQFDDFGRFIKSFDDSVHQLTNASEQGIKYHKGTFKKEFQKIGSSFLSISKAFELDTRKQSNSLTEALVHTSKTYCEVGQLFSEQPNADLYPLLERLSEYKRLLYVLPEIMVVHRSATNKIQEHAGRFSESEIETIQSRADVITLSVLAEMNHVQEQRVTDFRESVQQYITAQIKFFTEVSSRLQQAYNYYDKLDA